MPNCDACIFHIKRSDKQLCDKFYLLPVDNCGGKDFKQK